MGALCNLVDIVLFVFFLIIAVVAPLIDAQTCLPQHLFPAFLVELKSSYTQFAGDYLFSEKPHFFVGLVWLELIFQWPLAVASLYGIAAGKSWLNTTCLIYGASTLTSMPVVAGLTMIFFSGPLSLMARFPVAALAELTRSNRASDTLLKIYFPFLGFTVLALLRGLFAHSVTIGKRPLLQRKKRA